VKFSNNHLLMHIRAVKRKLYSLEIFRWKFSEAKYSRMGFYVRTCERSCEHSRQSSISRISQRCRRQPASLPPIEAGVLRAQRARVTYEFKGFRETPCPCARSRGEQRTGRLLSSSTAWGRMKTSRASWQLKVCHFSLLLRTFALPPSRTVFLSHCTLFFLRPLHATYLLCFLPFPPLPLPHPSSALVPPAVRFWREEDRQRVQSEKMDKDQENQEGNRGITNA